MTILEVGPRRRSARPPAPPSGSLPRRPPEAGGAPSDCSDVVRSLCHDLRQPLAAINLMARGDEADTQSRLEGIRLQVAWLSALVDSVLGDTGSNEVVVLDLAELVGSAARGLVVPATTGLSLRLADGVQVRARRVPLVRAILCLLDNALRAAGETGLVELSVRRRGAWAVVTVTDDGPGLGRLAPQHSLGLVTARAVLADCAGHLDLDDGVAGGAVATVTIPLAVEPGTA